MYRIILLGLFVGLLAIIAGVAFDGVAQEVPAARYVGSQACAGCHEDAARSWEGSHHALAWTDPSAATVVADFDGTSFTDGDMIARFSVGPDGTHEVDVTEADGSRRNYPVHSVVGIEPLQQYLLETEPGRLQSFDVVWDTEAERWFHLYAGSNLAPDDGMHWTGPYKTWNGRCAVCHATGYEKNYDPLTKMFASKQVEKGVGCEACHGPGSIHVASASGEGAAGDLPNAGLPVDTSDPAAAIEQCAGCHSRREPLAAGTPPPGTPFDDAYNLSLLLPGLYHADGQTLDEVYVYGSFLQSKMYAKGVTCTNCHEPHAARLKAAGNAVCTQCHNPAGNPEFPSIVPADYDSPAHTHHEAGTPGAACKSCHMVERVYMGNDWRADHSFRIPRPDLAGMTGAPDACTTCHADRDPAWAAGQIAAWFPGSDNRGAHYGTTLAAGQADPAQASAALLSLAQNSEMPGVVRGTALWLLARSGIAEAAPRSAALLADPDALVRAAATEVQRLAAPAERVSRLTPLLDDTRRNVRIAAARALAGIPAETIPQAARDALARADGEWKSAVASRLDFPETQLQRAGIALTNREFEAARDAFREVVTMDPQRVEAWVMLVRIAAAMGEIPVARETLRDALYANPADPNLGALRRQYGPL
ncbi:multiheme c-type cytochrome [Acuticoccus sp. MNP-M23]|uniref:cytochrome c3 family protein n=1 Tax=Acuticoccus sp. MNP-M23 TaxID=3072793 RepID=UPI002814E6CE|nr:multiheme c-type cytochrome [Acuticoccus sp. MNP-M23]WMS43800.1 multiheme c-type cytochrome [Acuticoccus sp. MNP-M23]